MSKIDADIVDRYTATKNMITDICRRQKRDQNSVHLIVVSKGHDFSRIKLIYDQGQRDFGESYAQELDAKMTEARAQHLAIRWHFIGAIQSNKLALIKDADVIHSIASVRHAARLHEMLDRPKEIFLQINLDDNSGRQGFLIHDMLDAITTIKAYANLKIIGLMTILPLHTDQTSHYWFRKMAMMQQQIVEKKLLPSVLLSMGMSDDVEDAILHGANYVRIGTRIFKERM